jgi:metallo-beta-lactamase class B
MEAALVFRWDQTCLAFALLCSALAFSSFAAEPTWPPGWTKPYPAHRVIGPLFNVGFEDLSVFLIETREGHILINTGLEDSTDVIQKNVESLGLEFSDIKLLLCMQAHFDHAAALAEIKARTGAKLIATPKDARVLEAGGKNDPHFGHEPWAWFAPIQVDRLIAQGQVVELGDVSLTVHEHPGHTEGSTSYSFSVEEDGQTYQVLIVNGASINPGKQMYVNPTYEGVGDDFKTTLEKQRALAPDVWVAAHGSQYGLDRKHVPGQSYSPLTFLDPEGYIQMVIYYSELYDKQVATEKIP